MSRPTRLKIIGILFLFTIKASLEGFGISLILPYIVALEEPELIFSNNVFLTVNRFFNIDTVNQLVLSLSFLLIAFFLIKNVFSIFVIYVQNRFFFTERSKLGSKLYKLYMDAPFDYHVNHHSAEMDRNLRFEVQRAYEFIRSIVEIITNLLLASAILIILFMIDWRVTLILLIMVGTLSFLFVSGTGKYSRNFGSQVQQAQLNVGRSIKEGLASVVEVKMWSAEGLFPARYLKYAMEDAKGNWMQFTINGTPNLFFEFLAISCLAGTIIALVMSNFQINVILPILAVFAFALIRMLPAISSVIKSYQMAKFFAPSVEVIYNEFIGTAGLARETPGTETRCNYKGDVERYIDVVGLSFRYRDAVRPTFQDIHFFVREGETIGITGPSGSGKTTFVNIFLSLMKPISGAVYWRGVNIADNVDDWRRNIGYVPQVISLLDTSIRKNIAFGFETSEIDENRIEQVVREAYLEQLVESMPEGIDTLIGENGVRLSGGQRQRLGIARALYGNPKVLIFDEATSSLDLEAEMSIIREIGKMSGSRTILMITHKIDTLKNCNRIFLMGEGRIQKSGTFAELFSTSHAE